MDTNDEMLDKIKQVFQNTEVAWIEGDADALAEEIVRALTTPTGKKGG